ncbi:MAG: hypothetical protein ACFHX7_22885 [Pseudomonadota bacterium]
MNVNRVREAEALFLQQYPDGFADAELQTVRKRHNVDQLAAYAQEHLTPTLFEQPNAFAEVLVRIISRSSMVSRFEKPAFRQFIDSLNSSDRALLASAYQARLTGRRKRQGFEQIVDMLARHRIARWSIVSAVPFYFAPTREVFVKPTTAKGIVRYLGASELVYAPTPTFEFYEGYRRLITDVKRMVVPSLGPNNAAITGFLMMSL